jgi:hypothetical protein
MDVGMYEALVGFAAGLFECGGQALLAQVIDGFFDVAAILRERFLAIEYAGSRFFSQFFDKLT